MNSWMIQDYPYFENLHLSIEKSSAVMTAAPALTVSNLLPATCQWLSGDIRRWTQHCQQLMTMLVANSHVMSLINKYFECDCSQFTSLMLTWFICNFQIPTYVMYVLPFKVNVYITIWRITIFKFLERILIFWLLVDLPL